MSDLGYGPLIEALRREYKSDEQGQTYFAVIVKVLDARLVGAVHRLNVQNGMCNHGRNDGQGTDCAYVAKAIRERLLSGEADW